MPGAAGVFEGFGDREDAFFFERAADDLDADGKAFVRTADGNRNAGEAGEIKPLRKAHGVEVAGAEPVVSLAMAKRGPGRNGREKDGDGVHLAEDLFAEKITFDASLKELIE